ncbi:MAG: hypothetical protein ACRCTQ_03240 [Brevinemataceae bacterium]
MQPPKLLQIIYEFKIAVTQRIINIQISAKIQKYFCNNITKYKNILKKTSLADKSTLSTTKTLAIHPHKIKDNNYNIALPPYREHNIQNYTHLTFLPQSSEHTLLIWNEDSQKDHEIKAWQIKSSSGLDILLPAYGRSAFLENKDIYHSKIQLFKIFHNNEKILINEAYFGNSSYTDINQCTNEELAKLKMMSFQQQGRSSDNNTAPIRNN